MQPKREHTWKQKLTSNWTNFETFTFMFIVGRGNLARDYLGTPQSLYTEKSVLCKVIVTCFSSTSNSIQLQCSICTGQLDILHCQYSEDPLRQSACTGIT